MLVYFPGTDENLRQLFEEKQTSLTHGWAVTEALRSVDKSLTDDDLEYHVTYSAADHCLQMPQFSGRRIVIAADVDKAAAVDDPGPGEIRVEVPISLELIDAFYVDVPDADGNFDHDEELAWFARQEISDLIARPL